MDSVAQSFLSNRDDAARRVLADAVEVLRKGGDHRTASSLDDVLAILEGRERLLDEPIPGLHALVRLAGRERRDPHGMLPGEHVRLVYPDRTAISGVWCYDPPNDEWPVGRNYVVRDDNGEQHDVGGGGVQIQPRWLNLAKRDRDEALARAVTVIASGWIPRAALPGALDEHDEAVEHEHLDYEQQLDPGHHVREHRRRCDCGEFATFRVTAWGPVANEMVMLLADQVVASPWTKAEEYASATVCSFGCAEMWREVYTEGAAGLLGEQITEGLRFDVQPWKYDPRFDDLPRVLAMAQQATDSAARAVQDAARAWLNDQFDTAATGMENARSSAVQALAYIAQAEPVDRGPMTFTAGDQPPSTAISVTTETGETYVRDDVHQVWMPSFPRDGVGPMGWPALLIQGDVRADRLPELLPSGGGTHPRDVPVDVWLTMAAPLVAKILDDVHRYEIREGGAVVYDRQTDQHIDGRTGLHHNKGEVTS